jgi:hypothetical protein
MRVIQKILLISFTLTLCFPSWVEESPHVVTVAELSRNPAKFDGRLVSVRAWLEFGWEGDNFLLDRSEPSHRNTSRSHVWLYCDPEHNRQVYGAVNGPVRRPVLATFTGYFYFIPDKKSRVKDVFDPGPLQLEATRVSDVRER